MSEKLKAAFLKKLEQASHSSESQREDPAKMKPSVLSQLLKDAILKKVIAMDKKYSVRGTLMPSAMKYQFRA